MNKDIVVTIANEYLRVGDIITNRGYVFMVSHNSGFTAYSVKPLSKWRIKRFFQITWHNLRYKGWLKKI